MSHKQGSAKKGWFRTPKRKLIALSAVAVLTIGGFFGVQAFTKSQAYGHMKLFAGCHSCAGGDHHVSFSDIPDDELKTRIACMVKLGAGEVDASGAQQDEITKLVTAAALDLKPVHSRMRGTGEAIQELLLAENVDRPALETLRAGRLADADYISKSLITVLADVSEVLSPEQRVVLNERIGQFRSLRHGKHHGGKRHGGEDHG
jgi:Spy/CpxP family protein refolding chaperone